MKAIRFRGLVAAVFLVTLATVLAGVVVVRSLGRWLVISEPLESSPVVVVLGGEVPFRALEAAALVKQGWASQVWLTRPAMPPSAEVMLTRLGIRIVHDDTYNRQILERLGVPSESIRVLPERATNTVSEVRIVASALRRDGRARDHRDLPAAHAPGSRDLALYDRRSPPGHRAAPA